MEPGKNASERAVSHVCGSAFAGSKQGIEKAGMIYLVLGYTEREIQGNILGGTLYDRF